MYPVLRRAAAATQELLQRRPSRGRLCASSVPVRETVAPMRRRRREGGSAQTTARRATVSALASTATRAHGRGSAATAARGTGETGRARSHGGFVDSRAVRRRKRVLWRPRKARGSRGWGRRARNVSKADLLSPAALARATSSRLALSNVRMRVLRFVQSLNLRTPVLTASHKRCPCPLGAYLGFTTVPYPKSAQMSSGAPDR